MRTRRAGAALIELAAMLVVAAPLLVGGLRLAHSVSLTYRLQDAVVAGARLGSRLEPDSGGLFETRVQDRVLAEGVPGLLREHIRVDLDRRESPPQVTVSIHGFRMPTAFASTLLEGHPRASLPYMGAVRAE